MDLPCNFDLDSCAVKGLIIELISQLQKKALNDIAKHSSPIEQAMSRSTTLKGEILALQSELDALSKWPLQIDTMLADEDQANEGHPDKVCDQVSDVVIDACLTRDTKCKIACETCVKDNMFMVPGEITVAGKFHHETVVQSVVRNIGLDSFIDGSSRVDSKGSSHQDCEVLFHVKKRSHDIAGGVHVDRDDLHAGNGDLWRSRSDVETQMMDLRKADTAIAHAMPAAEGTQQPHRSKQHHGSQQQQATNKQRQQAGHTEEEEKENEEGEEKERGEKEKEERERRKSERGKKEERRGAEEEGHKEVKKDVTDWTVVTRNKKQRKMIQIFVKVDGSKVTPMEVSLTDGKVEDVMRQIQKDEDVYVTMHGKALRRNEKLKSCGVTDGCTIQVTSRMRGGGRHKDKRSKADMKRGMDESGQKDQQVESLIDKCQEATQAQKDVLIQLFEENDADRRMITMISEAEDEEHEIQRFGKQLQSGVDEERAKLMELGMRWAVEARKRGRGAEQEQRRQEEQRQRRHEEQGQNTGQEQGKKGKQVRFGEEEQNKETLAESTDELEATRRLAERKCRPRPRGR